MLDAEGVSLNLPEALLRLACSDYHEYTLDSQEEEFLQLNFRAKGKGKRLSLQSKVINAYRNYKECER